MKIEVKYLFWALCFYVLSMFADNARMLLLLSAGYFLLFFYLSKNLCVSLFSTYLVNLPFQIGKTLNFTFLSRTELNLPYRASGIESMFVISTKEIILVAMAVLILHQIIIRRFRIKFDLIFILLSLYFVSILIATLFGAKQKEVSLLFCLYEIKPLILYVFWQMILSTKIKVLPHILSLFIAMVILQFALIMFQLFQEKPLGLTIEPTRENVPIDPDLELGSFQIRPTGTFLHSSNLISFILPFLAIYFPFLFQFFNSTGGAEPYIFIMTILIAVATLSRGAWLVGFLVIMSSLWMYEKKWRQKLSLNRLARRALFWLTTVVVVLLPIFVIPRVLNSFTYLDSSGGLTTRARQINETVKIIRENFLWGVGLETDTAYVYKNSQKGSIFRIFPEPVHNYYLRLALQVGIFPLLIFISILILLFQKLITAYRYSPYFRQKASVFSFIMAVSSICLYANFQPVLSLSDVVLFTLIGVKQNENWFST